MIHLDPRVQFQITPEGIHGLKSLKDGATVKIDVLGKGINGLQLLRINGKILTAYPVAGLEAGQTLTARVRLLNGQFFLQPLAPALSSGAELSGAGAILPLGEEAISRLLVSFFAQIGLNPDPEVLKRLRTLIARFPGKERSAALAAVILEERGLTPEYQNLKKLIAVLDGSADEDGENADSNDFLALINHKAGSPLHWVVFPFTKTLSGTSCKGSLRFLLDTGNSTVLKTELKAHTSQVSWFFSINSGILEFDAAPQFDSDVLESFIVYLKSLPGIEQFKAVRRVNILPSVIKSVDVEV